MRYLTGAFGVVAALGFVIYSAVTTWHVAYEMTTQFKELAGWAASGIVLWECLGLLYVRQCWNNGSRLLAIGGLALVLAAAVYTLRLDLRFHVAGQSDLTANRNAGIENRDMVRSELLKSRARRDELLKSKKLTGFQQEEAETLGRRISALEMKWDTQTVTAGGMPEAGWASRMLGKVSTDESWWTDALMVFGLVFWALARMLALPLAIASMQSVARKPVQAVETPKGMDVASEPSMAVLARPLPSPRAEITPREDVARIIAAYNDPRPAPPKPDDTPPPADAKPVEEAEPGNGGGGMPVKVATGPVLVTDDWERPEQLTPKQRKKLARERAIEQRQNEAIKAVEEFAAARLDLQSPNARFVRSDKDFVKSGGMSGTELGKAFRRWALSTHKWRHLADYNQNPLGKAMSAVIEKGRPTTGGGSVYAALLRKEANAIAA